MKKKSSKLLVGLLSFSMIFSGGILPLGLTHLDSYAATQQQLDKFKLKIKLVDAETGQEITENKPVIEMKHVEEEDDEFGDTETYTITDTELNGAYTVYSKYDYDITVKANANYKGKTETGKKFTGTEGEITYEIKLDKQPQSSEAVKAAKKKIEDIYSAHKIKYAEGYTLQDYLKDYIKKADIAGSENITYEVVESEDEKVIDKTGKIHYVDPNVEKIAKNHFSPYFRNINCKIKLSDSEGYSVTEPVKFMVGWDLPKVEAIIKSEATNFNKESIKGENASLDAVESPLNLPTITGTDMRDSWATIDWEASPAGILEITDKDQWSPLKGKIATVKKKPAQDTEVTLLGTFKVNETPLNTNVDDKDKIKPAQVSIKVKVKGTGAPAATEQDLKELLDKYYKPVLQENITKSSVEGNGVLENVQLPRYTRIKDDKNKLVFENKEINVTSSNDKLAKVNGYNLIVDPLYNEKDVTLTVTFKRGQLTVTQDYPIKLGTYSEDVFAREKQLMDYAKAHYFDGIKGENSDADHIKYDLRTFSAMTLDGEGNPNWIRELPKVPKVDAVVVDDFFDDAFVAETNGYNKFKSTDHNVIEKEALRVHRQPTSKKVEVSSLLTSARFKNIAKNHLDDPKIAALYKQEVKADLKVVGTEPAKPELKKLIDNATSFAGDIAEGDAPGQYKAGTKEKLNKAIQDADKVYKLDTATEEAVEAQIEKLTSAISEAEDSQNAILVTSTVTVSKNNEDVNQVRNLEVYSNEAEKYGYKKAKEYKHKVTVADALAKIFSDIFGEDFKANPKSYFDYNEQGFIQVFYKVKTSGLSFYVNDKMPVYPGTTTGSVVNDTVLTEGDSVRAYIYQDTKNWSDYFMYFTEPEYTGETEKDIDITLNAIKDWKGNTEAAKDAQLAVVNSKGETVAEATTDAEGKAVFNIDAAGTYTVKAVSAGPNHPFFVPLIGTLTVTESQLTKDKAEAIKSLSKYENLEGFTAEEQGKIDKIVTDGKTAIKAATNSADVNKALDNVKKDADKAVKEIKLDKYKAEKTKEVNGLDKPDQFEASEHSKLADIISTAKAEISQATSNEAVDTAVAKAKTEIAKLKKVGSGTEEPGTPGTEEPGTPGTPGTEEPGTPGTEEPGTPGTEEPGTPGTVEPGTPGTEEPGTPGTEEPGAPVIEAPTTDNSTVVLKQNIVDGDATTEIQVSGKISSKDGEKVGLVVKEIKSVDKMNALVDKVTKGTKLLVVGKYEVHLTDNAVVDGKLTVKLPVKGTYGKNAKVTVIHLIGGSAENKEVFKHLPVENGFVTVEVSSLSPFIVAIEKDGAAASGSDVTRSNKTKAGSRANTGDTTDLLMYLFVLSAMSLMTAVVLKRKEK